MDFRGRGNQASSGPAPASVNTPAPATSQRVQPVAPLSQSSKTNKPSNTNKFKVVTVALLFALAALLISVTMLFAMGGRGAAANIERDKYQAVFLNNGQVYFGKIARISSKTLDLQGIYYLQTNNSTTATDTTAQNANVSLVKLGCELHSPEDRMLINSNQVIFWENIKDDGQVVKAIKEYGDRSCSQQSQSSTQQSPSTTSPTSSTGAAATGTSNSTSTKTP